MGFAVRLSRRHGAPPGRYPGDLSWIRRTPRTEPPARVRRPWRRSWRGVRRPAPLALDGGPWEPGAVSPRRGCGVLTNNVTPRAPPLPPDGRTPCWRRQAHTSRKRPRAGAEAGGCSAGPGPTRTIEPSPRYCLHRKAASVCCVCSGGGGCPAARYRPWGLPFVGARGPPAATWRPGEDTWWRAPPLPRPDRVRQGRHRGQTWRMDTAQEGPSHKNGALGDPVTIPSLPAEGRFQGVA